MDKLRQRQEITAYRIVRRHVLKIVNSIPLTNMGRFTIESLIISNVSKSQIRDMYFDIYSTLGKPQYKRSLVKFDFDAILMQWLTENAGIRIISVQQGLIKSIIEVIQQGYNDNLSIADITRNLTNRFGWYKYQALRIARTETTTATNYATSLAGQDSEWEMEKQWISVQDSRTRREEIDHLHMNGVKVGSMEKFNVSGDMMDYPGDMDKGVRVGQVVNCRCKIVYLVKEDEDGLPIRKIKQ